MRFLITKYFWSGSEWIRSSQTIDVEAAHEGMALIKAKLRGYIGDGFWKDRAPITQKMARALFVPGTGMFGERAALILSQDGSERVEMICFHLAEKERVSA